MSGGGSQNTITQSGPPSWLMPYYQTGLGQAGNLLQAGGPQYYPGNTVAPLNPMQEQGLTSIQDTATGPNATTGAENANQFMTSGALLNPNSNPYLQNTAGLAYNSVQNQLGSEFAGSGRNIIGSLPIQSDEMNNIATQLYGGEYNTGLNTMLQASAQAPSLDQSSYMPGQQLLQTGSGLQSQTQNLINANMNQWNYNQSRPYQDLSWYSSLLSGAANPFSQSSQSTSQSANPFSTAMGVGTLGASLYPAIGAMAGDAAASAAGTAAATSALGDVGAMVSDLPLGFLFGL